MSLERRKSICVITTGCVECYMDANLLENYFDQTHGFTISDDYLTADYIIILGCAFNQHAEDYTRTVIDHVDSSKKQDSEFLVMGCISRIIPDLGTREGETSLSVTEINDFLSRWESYGLQVVTPTRNQDDRLAAAIKERKKQEFLGCSAAARAGFKEKVYQPLYNSCFNLLCKYKDFLDARISEYHQNSAFLRICMGCQMNCSYCAIRISRGRVKSKPLPLVVSEFKQLLDQGYTDITLTGTNIGDYGRDLKLDLMDVFDKIIPFKENFRLRLRNLNPRWLIRHFPEFSDLLGSGKIAYFHPAIQSGNDRLLTLMNRGHRAEELLECIRKIRRAYPAVVMKTDIMVGFPGETEAEFADSLKILDEKLFDLAAIMRYTDRPGTRAAAMTPKVPEPVIMKRFQKALFKELFSQPLRKARTIHRLNYQPLAPGTSGRPALGRPAPPLMAPAQTGCLKGLPD